MIDRVLRFFIAKLTPKVPILAWYVARLQGIVPKTGTRANERQVNTRGCRYPYKTLKYKVTQKQNINSWAHKHNTKIVLRTKIKKRKGAAFRNAGASKCTVNMFSENKMAREWQGVKMKSIGTGRRVC